MYLVSFMIEKESPIDLIVRRNLNSAQIDKMLEYLQTSLEAGGKTVTSSRVIAIDEGVRYVCRICGSKHILDLNQTSVSVESPTAPESVTGTGIEDAPNWLFEASPVDQEVAELPFQ